jgi:hypothetical protein
LRRPPTAFGHHERGIDEAFFFIERTSVAKFVGNLLAVLSPPSGKKK